MKQSNSQQVAWDAALEWLFRLHENPDNPTLLQAFHCWQQESEENAQAWRTASQVWMLTGSLPASPQTEPAAARLPDKYSIRTRSRVRRLGFGSGIAACLLLSFLLAFQALSGPEFHTRHEVRTLSLTDGSTVAMAAATKLDLELADDRRLIHLHQGSAFFQVAPDRTRPFIVKHGTTRIEVLGTAFEVASHVDSLSVRVQEGSVRVQNSGQWLTPLQAGEALRITHRPKQVDYHAVKPDDVAAWREGRLIANNLTIGEVIEHIAAYHPGHILVRDKQLANRRITGAFDLSDPAAALTALVSPFDAEIKHYTPYLLIVEKLPNNAKGK